MTGRLPRVLRRASLAFLPLAVLATGLAGTVYVVAQQGLRTGADAVPLALAEDAARQLDDAGDPSTVVRALTSGSVDLAAGLDPFVTVFDASGHVIVTNALLDGGVPVPPAGVLTAAMASGEDRVTWQPRPGVRMATVTVPWSGGTVMAGQSLREVERREDQALLLAGAGWAATLLAVATACLVAAWLAGDPPRGSP